MKMENKICIVEPYTDISVMWSKVLRDARTTVGKFETGNEPSKQFKESILRSKHSPIRGLIFEVYFPEIPYHITQQFSRHHIALDSTPNMQFCEDINPIDIEHFVQTSRSDRTGKPRSERKQDDNVQYRFRANAQGLIDASKKRLCLEADAGAVYNWKAVKKGIEEICPELASRMQPECVCSGFCPEDERLIKCKFSKTEMFNRIRAGYIK